MVKRRERLVERLHPVLGLTRLHHRIDLMNLVLTDQIADRGIRHQDFHRHDSAFPARALEQRLAEDPLEHEGKLCADLGLLVGGEDIDDAVDGRGRGVGVQGSERQVARLGDAQRRFDRL